MLALLVGMGSFQGHSKINPDPLEDAEKWMDQKEWEKAIHLLEKVYSHPGDLENIAFSNVISNLGYAYWQSGNLEKGRYFLAKSANFKREENLTHDPSYSRTLQNLAHVLKKSGAYDQSKIFLQEAIDNIFENEGPNNISYISAISNMAQLCYEMGAYRKAYLYCKEAFNIVGLLFPVDSPEYADISSFLGRIFTKLGEFREAEFHLKHAISVFQTSKQDNYLKYAQSLESLGVLYEIQGRYSEAERILLQTLDFKKSIPGVKVELLIETLNDLGILYQHLGNLEKASGYFLQVKKVCQETLSKEHNYYAIAINNLATIAKKEQAFEKARSLFNEALVIYEHIHGTKHPLYADVLNNLATIESQIGDYEQAEKHYKEVLRLDQDIYGEDHPHYATTLNNYGILLFRKGEIHLAEEMYLKSLSIRKQSLGINHPTYAGSLESLGLYYYSAGKLIEAERYFREAIDIQKKQIRTIFPVLTENERKVFYETISKDIERYNHIAVSLLDSNPELIEEIIDNQIQTKAILMTASEKVRGSILSSGNPQLIEDYESWKILKTRLVRYYHVGKNKLAEHGIDLKGLESKIEQLEKRIIHSRGNFEVLQDIETSWEIIHQNLAPDEVALEIVRIRDFDQDRGKENLVFGFSENCEYLVIILDPNKSNPGYVRITNGNKLENELYAYYKNALHYQVKDILSYSGFWELIDQQLDNRVRRVMVSPDGVYHKINPNILVSPDGKYIIDKYFVNYLTNCTDLLTKEGPIDVNKRAYLIGNPEFKQDGGGQLLSQLPGTGKEIDQIQNILEKRQGWTIKTLTREKASEYYLKGSYRPNLLHIATHGFYTNSDQLASTLVPAEYHNMFKSGVYLAGVENTFSSYQTGHRNDPFNDGVLTAYEAMNLDLERTEIVILSACYTGMGDVINGQGVFGLQRAFIVAGASNVIISLARIDDATTKDLMAFFYENFEEGQRIDQALRNAQLKLRDEYPHPFYWGAFMLVGKGARS